MKVMGLAVAQEDGCCKISIALFDFGRKSGPILGERNRLFTAATSSRVLNAAGPSETFHAPAS